jgi:hypothetical protein
MATSLPAHDPPPGYRAGFQATKLIGLTAFSAACAAGAGWWGVDIARTWGMAEADGGVLRPLWQRAALGLGVGLLGMAFLAAMLVFWRFYIVALQVDGDGRTLRIRRLPPLPELRLDVADVKIEGQRHTGQASELGPMFWRMRLVHAPWLSVRVRGRRWPMVLDLQGRLTGAPKVAPRRGGDA